MFDKVNFDNMVIYLQGFGSEPINIIIRNIGSGLQREIHTVKLQPRVKTIMRYVNCTPQINNKTCPATLQDLEIANEHLITLCKDKARDDLLEKLIEHELLIYDIDV